MRYLLSLLTVTLLMGATQSTSASTRTATPSIDIELLPERLEPGEEYEIRYATSEPGYVILYAIDTRGYVNLLYPLEPELDGDGSVLPRQEYSLSGIVAGVRSGHERIVALFTRNYLPIPQQRSEFLARDPDDVHEINYHLARQTTGLRNFNVAWLQVGYSFQGATSPDYEPPERVDVVHVYLHRPDPWVYYSGYHYSWWWHCDRYWYPHRYRYWRVSWHSWYGPFYDPWYGPWYYSWYDPWYYHHHGYYYASWHHHHGDGWWSHGGSPAPDHPDPPRVPRRFDRRRTGYDDPEPDNSRVIAVAPPDAITGMVPIQPAGDIPPAATIPSSKGKTAVSSGSAERSGSQPAVTPRFSKRKSSGSGVTISPPRSGKSSSSGTVVPEKKKRSSSSPAAKSSDRNVRSGRKSSSSSSGQKKKSSDQKSESQTKKKKK